MTPVKFCYKVIFSNCVGLLFYLNWSPRSIDRDDWTIYYNPEPISLVNTMQAFKSIRVLDFTHVFAGPFATCQLTVMGAKEQLQQLRGSGFI